VTPNKKNGQKIPEITGRGSVCPKNGVFSRKTPALRPEFILQSKSN